MTPRASVVVPAFNAASTLDGCLMALTSQSVPTAEYEIIVVDDGSTDATAEIAARYAARCLRQRHLGAAAARNLGFAGAAGEIILFTDADCAPAPTWVEQMTAPFTDPQVSGVKGVYAIRQTGLVPRFVQAEYEERYRRLARYERIDFVDTYSAGYRRQVLADNGGFDTAFPDATVEDQELSYRLAERGHRLVFAPAAVVYHQHPATVAAYCRRKFRIGYWKVLVHRKHPGKAWNDSHTPLSVKLQTALLPAAALALLGWPLWPGLGPLFWAAVALFALSVLPLEASILSRDPAVVLVAPFLLACRAASLAAGLALGTLGWLTKGLGAHR